MIIFLKNYRFSCESDEAKTEVYLQQQKAYCQFWKESKWQRM